MMYQEKSGNPDLSTGLVVLGSSPAFAKTCLSFCNVFRMVSRSSYLSGMTNELMPGITTFQNNSLFSTKEQELAL
jgi:hypothetical protein